MLWDRITTWGVMTFNKLEHTTPTAKIAHNQVVALNSTDKMVQLLNKPTSVVVGTVLATTLRSMSNITT